MNIPTSWTFEGKEIAANFDAHVREQLPFYDLVTQAVVHLGRHYIPHNGIVYDIGASTGNITMALNPICFERRADIYPIESSQAMVDVINARTQRYCIEMGCPECWVYGKPEDALKFDFKMYDFAVCFLTFMFLPIGERKAWLGRMRSLIKPGGAFVIVDKIITPSGYVGTVLRRLALDWKMKNGASPDDIIKKELSLAGYQRPLDERDLLQFGAQKFFQLGEFAGWVIERGE